MCFNIDGIKILVQKALLDRHLVHKMGRRYKVQNNRMNNQVITQTRYPKLQIFYLMEVSLDILQLA